ncbi:hypothetical protein LPB03_07115 [Polaribacter vadi]|uniref:Glycosyl transferase family 1 domain-containing protein n=1 Tax=Polaribacter vadi TaxID=1774273 RepID=A0A1B8TZ74_9FLAO|nr:glycosyltransferase [Polaribacter vadi]AOW17248.1 hypothetical protein LPB03_07115 [Polaribacter vadi]OBY64825.1 hypothetical protein LPB3_05375 [Polaribacter vadi]
MKNLIVIYTFSSFPSGDANANRIYAMALSFKSAGYKVIVLTNTLEKKEDLNKQTGKYVFKGITYKSYFKPNLKRLERIGNRYNIKKILKTTLTREEREKIYLICSSYKNYSFFLHHYLKNNKIPALVDATEWHNSFQFKHGKYDIKYIMHNLTNKYLIAKAKNIICISTYLETYYKLKGCNTINLPPQIVIKDYAAHNLIKTPPLTFFYAGSILPNDPIGNALAGFAALSVQEKKKIKVIVAGCTIETLQQRISNGREITESLGDSLSVIGRISKTEVQHYLAKINFIFLLRPVIRYSKAGFPSKVPEALASGVPVILNLTSDLENYIIDGENGLLVADNSANAFYETIKKAIALSDEKLQEMSNSAFDSALKRFDYNNYNKVIKEFLEYRIAIIS